MFPPITEDGLTQSAVLILDQTLLPMQARQVRLTTLEQAAQAIRTMQVRGAPLIGVTAAYGVALGLTESADHSDASLDRIVNTLAQTRPTAVNLHWALARIRRALSLLPAQDRRAAAWREARAIAAEDVATNAAIGRIGLPLLSEIAQRKGSVQVMTHCNAGWLATAGHGTALSPIYAAHETGIAVHVWVSETRPRNQGLLTAWELEQSGVPHTLLADNAAGLLMMQGKVDMVIVGADRIAANGDTANKVGTYLKALAARAQGVPFYVAAPRSTIDFNCPDGAAIPIEERSATELGYGEAVGLGQSITNPAFDITPTTLIDGILTETGLFAANELKLPAP